jgi:transcriptional regulator with XRE-family HTH domain
MFAELGISANTLHNMKTSMPKTDTLAKIADYLNVSVDYLLGRETKNSTPDQIRSAIINRVYAMSDEQAEKLLDLLESLVSE